MKNYSRIFNYICALLMLVLLVTQFLPFWTCHCAKKCGEEGKELSVSSYVWFPKDHAKGITKDFDELISKFELNDVILTPVVILVCSVLGIFFCIIKAKNPLMGIFPFLAGLAGTFGYLTNPVLKAGMNWQIHLIASIAVLAASLVVLSKVVVNIVQKAKKEKAERAQ